ncbi:MAG: glycosyltransferase [Lachnospiraceae bacterium]|nr:glycosyltransferase [Lachnospiraceae bacterium]
MNVVLIRSNPVKPCPRTEKMAGSLIRRGYGVTVIAWDRDSDYPPKEEKLELGDISCRIIRIGLKGQFAGGFRKNLKSLLKFQRFIYQWLKENRNEYDTVYAIDLDTAYIAQKAANRFHKVFVYDIADYYSNGHGYTGILMKLSNQIENRVINKAFATVICTEERKEEIKKTHPKRLYIIHNTPNLSAEPYIPEKHERVRFAYIGVFGNTRFLPELTEYIAKRKDCELHIGGFGANMEAYFKKMAAEHDNIVYYGRTPYTKTIEIERESDILPIIYDPSLLNHVYAAPNKFYEALALGKPMIMAKGTGMSSIVEKYYLGETMEYNIAGLEKAVNNLISKRNQWDEIGSREQEIYKTRYSWVEMEKRIDELYSEIIKELKQ